MPKFLRKLKKLFEKKPHRINLTEKQLAALFKEILDSSYQFWSLFPEKDQIEYCRHQLLDVLINDENEDIWKGLCKSCKHIYINTVGESDSHDTIEFPRATYNRRHCETSGANTIVR